MSGFFFLVVRGAFPCWLDQRVRFLSESFWNLILSCKLFNHPFQVICPSQIQWICPLVFIPVIDKTSWADMELWSLPLFSFTCALFIVYLWPLSVFWLTSQILNIGSNLSIPRLLSSYEFILGPSQNSPAKELPFMVKIYEKLLAYKKMYDGGSSLYTLD